MPVFSVLVQTNVNCCGLLASLDLLSKVKGAHSRAGPDAAKDRW